jgi:hypothetical protein
MKIPAVYVETHILLVFLIMAGVTGLLGSAVLMLRPDWLVVFGKYANRWISTRKYERAIERTINFDRWFYRHARSGGVLLLSGACWIVLYFTVYFDKAGLAAILSSENASALREMDRLLDGAVLLALAGGVFAAMASLFLLLRPSLLRDFEQEANRWVSTRRALRPLDIEHGELDGYVLRHYRVIGVLLLFISVFILSVLVYQLR